MSGEPEIFTLLIDSVLGELGPGTKYHHYSVCPVCGVLKAPDVLAVEYVFDRWGGHDLVTAMRVDCVSRRLREAMEKAQIKGVRFESMKVSKAEYFELEDGAYAGDLPEFFWMVITGEAEAPHQWATPAKCPTCGVSRWKA